MATDQAQREATREAPKAQEPKAQEKSAKSNKVGGYDSLEDAQKDYDEKLQKLSEANAEAQAVEQALPQLKVEFQQKYVDHLKEQDVEYAEDGRPLGIQGTPASNPTMYGGNPTPDTLGTVH